MRTALSIAAMTLALGLASRPMLAQALGDASPLEFLSMIDAQTGWASTSVCGSCPTDVASGLMLRTINGGTQWKDVTPLSSSGHKIAVWHFIVFSPLTVWIMPHGTVGSATQEIFRTVDGGETWKGITIPAPAVTAISFINSREGWLVAFLVAATGREAVEIHRSIDGGDTWTKVAASEEASGLPLYGSKDLMTFLNSTTGFISVGDPTAESPQLYVTLDSGRTWRRKNLPVPQQPQQSQHLPHEVVLRQQVYPGLPKFFTPQDGIMLVGYHYYLFNKSTLDTRDAGSVYVLYVTRDGGVSWTYTTPVSAKEIYSIRQPSAFVDTNHGWLKEGNTLYVTDDGGRRWTPLHPNQLFADVTRLDFISPEVGWAIRNTDPAGGGARQTPPFLLKTLEGGRTWTPLDYAISR